MFEKYLLIWKVERGRVKVTDQFVQSPDLVQAKARKQELHHALRVGAGLQCLSLFCSLPSNRSRKLVQEVDCNMLCCLCKCWANCSSAVLAPTQLCMCDSAFGSISATMEKVWCWYYYVSIPCRKIFFSKNFYVTSQFLFFKIFLLIIQHLNIKLSLLKKYTILLHH